jgi:cobaltochelatase CobS
MSASNSISLPGNSRQAVRAAVRAAMADQTLSSNLPAGAWSDARAAVAGRKINDLPNGELVSIAQMFGIDVAAIVRGTAAEGAAAIRVAAARDDGDADGGADGGADGDADGDADGGADGDATAADLVDVKTEATTIRRELARSLVEGDFDTVEARIAGLLTDARKPAEVRVETIYVTAGTDAGAVPAGAVIRATGPAAQPLRADTWGKLFSLKGGMSSRKANVYAPGPNTPPVDARYRWPESVTQAALCAMGRARNVWLFGPAGTGKSSFGEQLAARTGRPFFLIPCDDTTEAPELVGMTVPYQGGVRWQDGVLTAAMRVPHAIILVDEPTVARAGAIMVLQSVLQSGVLSIKETGECVRAAEGVRFLVADNTNGTGGGSAEGYEGTRRMNRATLDRFASFLRVDYMKPGDEAEALVAHTGCTPQLAAMLVECAGLTRKAKVTHALGLRRLIAWAECLTDGLDPRAAFEFAILNSCARDDREPTEQCCALGLNKSAIKSALAGVAPGPVAPPPIPGSPAADFAT